MRFKVNSLFAVEYSDTLLGDVISEFVGVASSMQLFGVSKFVSVPIAALLVWFVVVFGDYKTLEIHRLLGRREAFVVID